LLYSFVKGKEKLAPTWGLRMDSVVLNDKKKEAKRIWEV